MCGQHRTSPKGQTEEEKRAHTVRVKRNEKRTFLRRVAPQANEKQCRKYSHKENQC